jgi:SH3-like domain-containing protein
VSEDVLNRIADWCKADPNLTFKTFKSRGPAIDVSGEPKIRLDMDVGETQLVLSHALTVSGVGEAEATQARSLFNKRGSLLRGSAELDDDQLKVEAWYEIFLEGLNRQTFLLGVNELAGAIDKIGPAQAAAAEAPAEEAPAEEAPIVEVPLVEAPAAEAAPAPSEKMIEEAYATFVPTHEVPTGGMRAWARPDPQLTPVAELAARVQLRVDETRGAWAKVTGENGWTGWVDARQLKTLAAKPMAAAEPPAQVAPVTQPEPVTRPLPTVPARPAAVWKATHEVPATGLSAWEQPNPQLQPVTTLAARVQLRVDEMRGAWAKVTAENGWTGWVDGRQLKKKGGGGAIAMGGLALRPLLLLAGVLLIIASFVEWVQTITITGADTSFAIGGTNSWGLPFTILWDYTAGTSFDFGWLFVFLGVAALVLGVVPRKVRGWAALIGVLAIAAVIAYTIQINNLLSDNWGASFGWVIQHGISVGAYLALTGGLVALVGAFVHKQ